MALGGDGLFAMNWTATDLGSGADLSTVGDSIGFNNKPGSNQDGCKGADLVFTFTAS